MEYLDLLPDENDLKGKTIEEQNRILEDTLQLFIDNVELNALHRCHRDPEGVGLRELLKKNPQWEIELTTRPVKMFFTKWVKEIDEAVGYQRAEKIETVISIYEGLLINECINKAAEYLRLKQIPEVEKCIDHFKEVLKTHHIKESTRKLTNPDQKAMSDNMFLNVMDYAAIAKEYLLLMPDLRFNYLEAIRKKYQRANNNMFELIANEIGKIKAGHLDKLSSNIFRMLQAGVELDFESELTRVKEQNWMPAIQGGHNFNSLEQLEQYVRDYAEYVRNSQWIEKNKIELPELLARAYRVMAVDKAIQRVEEIINKQRGELGKAQFAQSDLLEPLKGLIAFWESELIFHKKRKVQGEEGKRYSIANIPKVKAKHFVLTYLFECHASGASTNSGNKKVLEQIGGRLMGEGKGNTFYKAFNEITDTDINSESNLIKIGGEDWRKIVLSISSNPDEVEKYLKTKQL